MKIVSFDTETNGLYRKGLPLSQQPYILQLSWLVINDNKDAKVRDFYIKIPDDVEIPKEATNINGITKEYLNKHGVNIQFALQEFMNDISNTDFLVAHNVSFDENMVNLEFTRLNMRSNIIDNLIPHNCKKYCTMMNGRHICNIERENKYGKYIKYPKLSELYSKLFPNEEEVENLHNSKVDVICTSRCFYNMHDKFKLDIFESIPNFRNEIKN